MAIRTITAWLWRFEYFRWFCISATRLAPKPIGCWLFFETPLALELHQVVIKAGDFEYARKILLYIKDYEDGCYEPSRNT